MSCIICQKIPKEVRISLCCRNIFCKDCISKGNYFQDENCTRCKIKLYTYEKEKETYFVQPYNNYDFSFPPTKLNCEYLQDAGKIFINSSFKINTQSDFTTLQVSYMNNINKLCLGLRPLRTPWNSFTPKGHKLR